MRGKTRFSLVIVLIVVCVTTFVWNPFAQLSNCADKHDVSSSSSLEVSFDEEVTIICGEDAVKINTSIAAVTSRDKILLIAFYEPVTDAIALLRVGDIFFLDGDETTPLGEPFFGKVASVSNDDGLLLEVTMPTFDEVFSDFDLSIDALLSSNEIVDIRALPGVELDAEAGFDQLFQAANNLPVTQDAAYRVSLPNQPYSQVKKSNDLVFNLDVDLMDYYSAVRDNDCYVKVSGTIGIEDLRLRGNVEFSKWYMGINNAYLGAEGNQIFRGTIDIGCEREFPKNPSGASIFNIVKIYGLDNKYFPIAMLTWAPHTSFIVRKAPTPLVVEKITKHLPVSVSLMVYMDIKGNIVIKVENEIGFSQHFDMTTHFVEKGKLNVRTEDNNNSDKEFIWNLRLAAEGAFDVTYLGMAVMLNVFNINIASIDVFNMGTIVEGSIALTGDFGSSPPTVDFSGQGLARGYFRLGEINMRVKLELWTDDPMYETKTSLGFHYIIYEALLFDYRTHTKEELAETEKQEVEAAFYDKVLPAIWCFYLNRNELELITLEYQIYKFVMSGGEPSLKMQELGIQRPEDGCVVTVNGSSFDFQFFSSYGVNAAGGDKVVYDRTTNDTKVYWEINEYNTRYIQCIYYSAILPAVGHTNYNIGDFTVEVAGGNDVGDIFVVFDGPNRQYAWSEGFICYVQFVSDEYEPVLYRITDIDFEFHTPDSRRNNYVYVARYNVFTDEVGVRQWVIENGEAVEVPFGDK